MLCQREGGERLIDNLKAVRKARGMTQQELADAANINRVTIAKYETGQIDPTLDSARKMADALGVTIDELVKGA